MSEDKPQDDIIDIEPQVIADAAPSSPAKRSGLRNAGLLAMFAVVAAVVGGWLYRDMLSAYFPNDQLHALSMRIDALEATSKDSAKRVDAVIALTDELKARVDAAQAGTEKSAKGYSELLSQVQGNSQVAAELKKALEQTKADLDGLKNQMATAGNSAGTATPDPAVLQRLEALEKTLSSLQGSAPAKLDVSGLKQALAALNEHVANGVAFDQDIAVVAREIPAAEGLDVLQGEAVKGVPNAKQLGALLAEASAQLPKASSGPTSDGWLDWISGLLSRVVTIKSVGPEDWSMAAAKAAALLEAGDLQQANALFSGPDTQVPAALGPWREALQRRIKVEEALAKVNAAAAREFSAKAP